MNKQIRPLTQAHTPAHEALANGAPRLRFAAFACVLPVLLLTSGCRIQNTKGQGDGVSMQTPMGGLDVKTDPAAVLTKVGLPAYPGAQAIAQKGDDKDAADVNLSFGSFHLQVLAAGLQTADDPGKVETFYRKALAQYSDVIACRDQQAVGTPAKTGMGLTCDDDKHVHTGKMKESGRDGLELKAGSPTRQHIASISQRDGATRIELVSLELPKGTDD